MKNTAFLGSPLFAYFALRHGSDSALKSVGLSAVAAVWASRRCVTTRRSARARSRGRSSARAGSRQVSCGRPRRAARRVCLPRRLHRHIRRVLPIRPSRRGRARRERGRFRASRRGDGRASRPPRRFQMQLPARRLPRPAAGCVRCASPSSERRARRAVWTIEGENQTSCRAWRTPRRLSRVWSRRTDRPRRSNTTTRTRTVRSRRRTRRRRWTNAPRLRSRRRLRRPNLASERACCPRTSTA